MHAHTHARHRHFTPPPSPLACAPRSASGRTPRPRAHPGVRDMAVCTLAAQLRREDPQAFDTPELALSAAAALLLSALDADDWRCDPARIARALRAVAAVNTNCEEVCARAWAAFCSLNGAGLDLGGALADPTGSVTCCLAQALAWLARSHEAAAWWPPFRHLAARLVTPALLAPVDATAPERAAGVLRFAAGVMAYELRDLVAACEGNAGAPGPSTARASHAGEPAWLESAVDAVYGPCRDPADVGAHPDGTLGGALAVAMLRVTSDTAAAAAEAAAARAKATR